MHNRILWADQAKALAISAMVLCHYGFSNPNCVKIFLYIWHMPIFFFISGYFDMALPFGKVLLIKNFKTLIIPYFFFSICAFSICWISPHLHPELYHYDGLTKTFIKAFVGMFLMHDYVRPYAFMPLGPLWFLVALFEVRILFAALSGAISKDKLSTVATILLLLLYSVSAYYYFFSCNVALMALPIYSLGYIFKRYNIIESVNKKWMSAFLSIIGFAYLVLIGMRNGMVSMDGADFGNSNIMFYVNAIIGSLSIIFMFMALNIRRNWLSVVGASTLTILGTHTYINKIGAVIGVLAFQIPLDNRPLWFLFPHCIIGIAFGVYCHKLIKKYIPWALGK